MAWLISVAVVVCILVILWLLGWSLEDAKPVATAFTSAGAAIAIWATYKAVEKWDDPAREARERLTSWGKFGIVLLLTAGALSTYADAEGDFTLRRLQEGQDSLRAAIANIVPAERNLSPPLAPDTAARPRPPASAGRTRADPAQQQAGTDTPGRSP